MTQRVEFGVPVAALAGVPEFADRLVYSYRFAPLSNTGSNGRPVLTKAQWVYLAKAAGLSAEAAQQWLSWHSKDIRVDPNADEPTMRMNPMVARIRGPFSSGGGMQPSTAATTDPFDGVLRRPQHDVLLDMARSQIGLLFLDRTRMRPAGFVVGEHIYTLGLAAGEEVVLEQKSFYQKELSAERTTEEEENAESETSESWTKDSSELMVGTGSSSRTDGFSAGGSAGFDYVGKVGVEAKMSDTATNADTDSRTTSTKEVVARSTKNTAKLRDLHKTVVKLSATDRFEQSARRTIRNPNAHTPIDLHWFKILRRIQFSHERFGVRLCWTPFVRDPASEFYAEEEKVRRALLDRANNSIPAVVLPPQPKDIQVPNATVVGLDPPMTELKQWGGWPGSDMSYDYTLPINVPANMKWDEDPAFVKTSLRVTLTGAPRGFAFHTVGEPWYAVNAAGQQTVFQVIHVGAGWRLTGSSQLWAQLSARVIPNTTSLAQEEAKAMAEWETACKKLQAERAAKVAVAEEQALLEFAQWRTAHRATLNPARELLRRFIKTMFNEPDSRDEIWELDVWDQVFDWELASAKLYSGTWNAETPLRDPSLPAEDFTNASWARLYLPVRPGYEETALRWMFLVEQATPGPVCIEDFITKVVKQLTDWRQLNLGGPDEVVVTQIPGRPCPDVVQKHVCLGTWSDDVPTDGVHIEVTQATTTAADMLTESRAENESERIAAMVAAILADGKVREALAAASLGQVDTHVHLNEVQ